jgi:hypothetical protein
MSELRQIARWGGRQVVPQAARRLTQAITRSIARVIAPAMMLAANPVASCGVHAQLEPLQLPLVVHMAHVAGQPVAPAEFVRERIARANEIFAPHGVAFVATTERKLDERHARLETRADRDALGSEVRRGAIDCFVVESLRDVDEPERMRRGVHWHSHTQPGAHFVIVSVIAGLDVLAHELGHFLGNPEHSELPGNLMSYQRGDGLPFLDVLQVHKLERALRNYLRRGELRALPKPGVSVQPR